MTQATFTYTEALTVVHCTCGIPFAIPKDLNRQALDNPRSKTIYCPLGHHWYYTGKSDAEVLQEKLDRAERRNASLTAQIDQEKASHAATKGQVTKLKKRAQAGMCPHCRRSFVQLARHVQNQHPDAAE